MLFSRVFSNDATTAAQEIRSSAMLIAVLSLVSVAIELLPVIITCQKGGRR